MEALYVKYIHIYMVRCRKTLHSHLDIHHFRCALLRGQHSQPVAAYIRIYTVHSVYIRIYTYIYLDGGSI